MSVLALPLRAISGIRRRFLPGLAILSVLALFGLALLTQGGTTPERSGDSAPVGRSIYSAAPSGSKAWYLTLKRSGLPLMVWDKPLLPHGGPPLPALLVLISPESGFDVREADALLDWVDRGHTVVLLDDFVRAGSVRILRRLAHRLVLTSEAPPLPEEWDALSADIFRIPPSADKRLAFRVAAPIRSRTERRLQDLSAASGNFSQGVRVLLEDAQHRAVLLSLPYGRGKLILGTVADLVENRFLHDLPNDNAQFLANVLMLERKPVLVDEFVHGYGESPDLAGYYRQKTPVPEMLTSLGLGFLFLLWLGLSRRPVESFRRLSSEPESTDFSPEVSGVGADDMVTFVDSLAALYERQQAAPPVLSPLLRRIDVLLKTRFDISSEEDAAWSHLLAGRLAPYSSESQDWPDVLRKARAVVERQQRLPARDVLRLSQQLIRIQEALQHGCRSFA